MADENPTPENAPSAVEQLKARQSAMTDAGVPEDADPERRQFRPLGGGARIDVRELTQDEVYRLLNNRHRADARLQLQALVNWLDDLQHGRLSDGTTTELPPIEMRAWVDPEGVPYSELTFRREVLLDFPGIGSYRVPAGRTFIEYPIEGDRLAFHARDGDAALNAFRKEHRLRPDPSPRQPHIFLDETLTGAPRLPAKEDKIMNDEHNPDQAQPFDVAARVDEPQTENTAEAENRARGFADIAKGDEVGPAVEAILEEAKANGMEGLSVRLVDIGNQTVPLLSVAEGGEALSVDLPNGKKLDLGPGCGVFLALDSDGAPRMVHLNAASTREMLADAKVTNAPFSLQLVKLHQSHPLAAKAAASPQKGADDAPKTDAGNEIDKDPGPDAENNAGKDANKEKPQDNETRRNEANNVTYQLNLGLADLARLVGHAAAATFGMIPNAVAARRKAREMGIFPDPNADPRDPVAMMQYDLIGLRTAAVHMDHQLGEYRQWLKALDCPDDPGQMTPEQQKLVANDPTLQATRHRIDMAARLVELHSEGIANSPLRDPAFLQGVRLPPHMANLAKGTAQAVAQLHQSLENGPLPPLNGKNGKPAFDPKAHKAMLKQFEAISRTLGKIATQLMKMLPFLERFRKSKGPAPA